MSGTTQQMSGKEIDVAFSEADAEVDVNHLDDLMELLLDAVMKEADCGDAERPDVSGSRSDAGGVPRRE